MRYVLDTTITTNTTINSVIVTMHSWEELMQVNFFFLLSEIMKKCKEERSVDFSFLFAAGRSMLWMYVIGFTTHRLGKKQDDRI